MTAKIEGRAVNRSRCAELFGVSLTTIDGWVRQGCPIVKRGRKGVESVFDTAAVLRWREERAAVAAAGETSDIDEREARRRKLAAEAALAEHELAVTRAAYVPVEHVAKAWGQIVQEFRTKMLVIPNNIAAQVDPSIAAGVEAIASRLVDDTLAALTKTEVAYVPADETDSPCRPAA